MLSVAAKKTQAHDLVQAVVRAVQARAELLQVGLWAWDMDGELVAKPADINGICAKMHAAGLDCRRACRSMSEKALGANEPICGVCPCGGVLLALPMMQRRRAVGVVAACFPVRQAYENGVLRELWRSLNLPAEELNAPGAAIRRTSADAQDLLNVIGWILERELSLLTSKGETEMLSSNLANTYEELSLLYQISGSMKVTQQPEDFFRGMCGELLDVMRVGAVAAIINPPEKTHADQSVVLAGEPDISLQQVRMLASAHIAGEFRDNRPTLNNDFAPGRESQLGSIHNFIAAPLIRDKSLMGMVIAMNRQGDFDSADLKLLNSLANQASVFLSNSRLYAELQDLLMGMLHALTSSIDAKDPYTCGHSQRVAALSRVIAQQLKLPAQKVHEVYLAGLLHDIGKIGVPESVLCKPGRLTSEEYEKIKLHPTIGARILGGIRQLDDIIQGILTHHERPDGKGYPQGLKGDQVPLEGRIICLADVFDAMTSDRTYRKALTLDVVSKELNLHKGAQFDPQLVDLLLNMDMQKILEEIRRPPMTVFPAGASEAL
ncbi:MAG: HD-GYP domain-containing protein [Planctomycetes bacterium]|jgi:HD-GYP domain-containing protein (c-di-GMP phosphodiesterase class II)|nr:HD-GYP domain-containing protein [Planctomycetota bacterium]